MCLGAGAGLQQVTEAEYLKEPASSSKYISTETYTTQDESAEGCSGSNPSDETPTTDSEEEIYKPRHWAQDPGMYPPAQQSTSTPVQLLPMHMPFMQAPAASSAVANQPILIPVCMTAPAGYFVIPFPAQSQCSQQLPTNVATLQQQQQPMMLQQQPQQSPQQQQAQQHMRPQQTLQQQLRERQLSRGTQAPGPAWMQQPSDSSSRLLRLERERPMTKGRMRRQIQRARRRLGKMQEAMPETLAASSSGVAAPAPARSAVAKSSSSSDDR